MDALTIVANPGSASRKYALYNGQTCLARLHFESKNGEVVYSLAAAGKPEVSGPAGISHITFSAGRAWQLLAEAFNLQPARVKTIALRIVAPAAYFQQDRVLTNYAVERLKSLEDRAPLHVHASLQELSMLRRTFGQTTIVGISDSAFHADRPDYVQHYAIPTRDTRRFDIKRFGYHGLSAESVVSSLKAAGHLPERLIICHLGSGASVTAVSGGKSIDTTMGYSPLEGLMMATRSGDIDVTAAALIRKNLRLSGSELQEYLNYRSGLLGVSGLSSDIRDLLKAERSGHARAALALNMYVSRVKKAIGEMAAVLSGADGLAFTGTVGERSRVVRRHIADSLRYLGLEIDPAANHAVTSPDKPVLISPARFPGKIYVIPADETAVMASRASKI